MTNSVSPQTARAQLLALLRLAFEAGRSGGTWLDFTFRDDVGAQLGAEARRLGGR